jgi:hypothetical protein
LKPLEFWVLTPAELAPYVESRIKWRKWEMKIEDQRFGMICATIANVNRDPKKTKPYTPAHFFDLGDAPKQPERPDPISFVASMNRLVVAKGAI